MNLNLRMSKCVYFKLLHYLQYEITGGIGKLVGKLLENQVKGLHNARGTQLETLVRELVDVVRPRTSLSNPASTTTGNREGGVESTDRCVVGAASRLRLSRRGIEYSVVVIAFSFMDPFVVKGKLARCRVRVGERISS